MRVNGLGNFLVASFVLAALLAGAAAAQSPMGTITGLITDSTGAVVPGVPVIAENLDTGVRARTVSSATGNYVIPNLPIGRYEVSVSAQGFKTWSRADITLSANQTIRVDVELEVGQISERVTITAQPPALQTESTELSTNMEQNLLKNMPLPIAGVGGGMRNAFSIMMMMPQVKSQSGESAWDDLQIGGGQQHGWIVSVDGYSVEMGNRNHIPFIARSTPPVDAIEEFRIDTSAFKAEDSRASGGNISIITKSGTNEFHGTLFEYYQSQKFNANSWRNNKLGRAKPVFHRNDFGASVGGPVFLPKVYNGKDRTYFFFTYEGYRYPQTAGVSELTVPLPEMREGDFSNWIKSGALVPIYDPLTTASDGKGGFTREVFPGNKIPADRLSPISTKIAQFYPDPNAPGLVRNYRTPGAGPRKRIENAFTVKLDQAFGVKNRFAFSFVKNGYHWNNAYDTAPELVDRLYQRGNQHHGKVFRFNDTHMFTPTLVNTVTVGFNRLFHPELDVTAGAKNWEEVLGGIKNNPGSGAAFPSVWFLTDNYSKWNTTKNWKEYHKTWGIDESLNWIRGNHNFKFGYTVQQISWQRINHNMEGGEFRFHRLETAKPLDNSGKSGSSFASFMLGALDRGRFSVPSTTKLLFPYHAFFVQDDWKITPKLTANIGIRFEISPAIREANDQISYFDPTLPNPAADGFPGALRFLGNGEGREGRRTFYDAATGWGPRLGFAYQLTPNTVIRAGAGIYYAPSKLNLSTAGFTAAPDWRSADRGVTPAFYWDDGFPAWTPPPFIDPAFNAGFSVSWHQLPDVSTLPTTDTWNFAISRSFPGKFVLDVTYTGSKDTHLPSDRVNYMQVHPKYAYLGSLLNKPIDDPAVVALGFTPPFPSFQALMGKNATLGQALRMFPQYTNVGTGGTQNRSGNATYHALMIRVTKRYSNGLSLLSSYTWSKKLTDSDSAEPWIAGVVGARVGAGAAQDHYNRRLEKAYGNLDFPHQFKLTASYDLPFGKGRSYLTEGVLSHIVGGWNLAAFVFAQSGYPMGVVDTAYSNYLFAGTPRPDVLSHNWRAPVSGDKFDPDKDLFYDRSTRMFGRVRENISIIRSFNFTEKVALDVRWEVYDLFNHHTWSRPSSQDLANTQFGKITNAEGNRTMQLGVKLEF